MRRLFDTSLYFGRIARGGWQHTWIINQQLARDAMPRAQVVHHRPFPWLAPLEQPLLLISQSVGPAAEESNDDGDRRGDFLTVNLSTHPTLTTSSIMEGRVFPDQQQLLQFLRRLKEVFDVCDEDADGFIRVEHLEDLGLQFGQGDEVRRFWGGYSTSKKLWTFILTRILGNKWWLVDRWALLTDRPTPVLGFKCHRCARGASIWWLMTLASSIVAGLLQWQMRQFIANDLFCLSPFFGRLSCYVSQILLCATQHIETTNLPSHQIRYGLTVPGRLKTHYETDKIALILTFIYCILL